MSSLDVIYNEIHASHAPHWCVRLERAAVCVACAVEMIDRTDVSAARKRVALACVMRAEEAREILYRHEKLKINFSSKLLKLLISAADPSLLNHTTDVLLQMSLDIQQEDFLQFILNEMDTQLSECRCVSVPSVMFVGKLMDVHSSLSQTISSRHLSLLERVCGGLLLSDEDLKTAVCYVLFRVWSSGAAVHTLPNTLRDRMCVLLLHTLSHTHTSTLTINCLGVLKQMCQYSEVVCVLMSLQECSEDLLTYHPLPLMLKKLLSSSHLSVQVVCVGCVCSVLVQSSVFSTSFIHADLPEFLFECVCSSSEVLLWGVFSCLLLLTEDPLFFTQCHSVYGIEPLVRSLKECLGKSNIEVQKQGLKLLTAILDRQPAGVRLFPTGCEFSAVSDVIVEGVASSCLQVSTCAVQAAAVLLRSDHQSSPVQLCDVRRVIQSVISKCGEYNYHDNRDGCSDSDQSVNAGDFLIHTLMCLQSASRLVDVCVCEQTDTVEAFCVFLLHCCDTVCIPAVTRVCEHVSSPQLLQLFLSVLSHQFSLSPDHMLSFSTKLASSGFVRLILQSKAHFCSGNRHVSLNVSCCDFLLKLCMCLFFQSDTFNSDLQADVECVLQDSLSSVCVCVSDCSSLLTDTQPSVRNTQCCIIYLLHLSLLHGDRLLSRSAVFCSVLGFVCVVEGQCVSLSPSVLCSALFLLSVCQDACPPLDTAAVRCVSKVVCRCPVVFSVCCVHVCVVRFVLCYRELSERFGVSALTGFISSGSEETREENQSHLLDLLHTQPSALLSVLALVCEVEGSAAHTAVSVLRCFMSSADSSRTAELYDDIRTTVLNILQKHTHTDRVCVLLDLLSVAQGHMSTREMDHTDFKLLYHVSNLVGRISCRDSELLLSVLNCLYCFLCVCPSHCTDRVLSLLLSNVRLMEVLEEVLSDSSLSSSSLHSCSLLLLSTLTYTQHTHSAQVYRSVCVDLYEMVRRLTFNKRHTDSLLLMSSVRFLQVCLDVGVSSLLCFSARAAPQRPLQSADAALHPFSCSAVRSLMTALCGVLLQKQDVMMAAAVNCLESLIVFLHRRNPTIAQHMVSQPWTGFLLFSLLSCESSVLHPAVLKLLTLMVCFSGGVSRWKADVQRVCEELERQGATDKNTHTLREMITQCCALSPPEDLRMKMENLLESLKDLPPSNTPTQHMIRVGRVCVCLSDFSLKSNTHSSPQ